MWRVYKRVDAINQSINQSKSLFQFAHTNIQTRDGEKKAANFTPLDEPGHPHMSAVGH